MDPSEIERHVAQELERVCPDGVVYSGDPTALLALLRTLSDGAGVDALIEAAEAMLGGGSAQKSGYLVVVCLALPA